ncbi:DNA primase TraC [Tepidimonas alkaliphilus]|uniref:DNA primase TraC n=1 Tax=Tepidimonas alkaliphilus TaxID=2588942 RepID=A0A554WB20_9BURK|nr:DUF3987 domain-containing protein [Tepidimonas alkaliphilus]TSE20755.1 DNA primase TraC [Tepidimonas alkaliphilus]
MLTWVDAVVRACQQVGLEPPRHAEPGRWARCDVAGAGAAGRGDGSAYVFPDGAGAFVRNWRTGEDAVAFVDDDQPVTAQQRRERQRQIEQARRQAEAERQQRQEEAAARAAELWRSAAPAPADHGYLIKKGIQPHGLRVSSDGLLLVPLRDTTGKLWSLQTIGPGGTKRFLPGGRTQACYWSVGRPDGVVVLCEGVATAASIYESTGLATAAAMSSGNLLPVARALRDKLPDAELVVAADNDAATEGNPGLTAAVEAAKAVGARLAVPRWSDGRAGALDFNDLHRAEGAQAVRRLIEAAEAAADDGEALDRETILEAARQRLEPDIGDIMPIFPVEALGPLAGVCRAIAGGRQVEAAIVGSGLLSVAALLASAHWDVETIDGDRRPLSLFALTAAASGTGKDAADRITSAAVYRWQRQANEAYQQALRDHEAALGSRKKGEPPPEPPTAPHRLCSDMTVEGLRRAFAEGVACQGVFSTEAAAVLAGHGFSAEHRAKTAAALCGLWDRGHLSVLRAGQGRFERSGLRLSAHLAVQPAAVAEALHDPLLAQIGLWPRFLLAWPPMPKPRRHLIWRPEDDPHVRRWWMRCEDLLALPEPDGERIVLRLSDEARQVLADFFEACERRAARGGDLWDVRPFALRAAEQATRVAGVLTAIRGHAVVSMEDAHNGVALASYSLGCWQAALGRRQRDKAADHALALLRWLLDRPGARATSTEIIRQGPRALRSAEVRDAAVARLVETGVVQVRGGAVAVVGDSLSPLAAKTAKAAKSLDSQGFARGEDAAKDGESPAHHADPSPAVRHSSPAVRHAASPAPQGFSPDSPPSPVMDVANPAPLGDDRLEEWL